MDNKGVTIVCASVVWPCVYVVACARVLVCLCVHYVRLTANVKMVCSKINVCRLAKWFIIDVTYKRWKKKERSNIYQPRHSDG